MNVSQDKTSLLLCTGNSSESAMDTTDILINMDLENKTSLIIKATMDMTVAEVIKELKSKQMNGSGSNSYRYSHRATASAQLSTSQAQ